MISTSTKGFHAAVHPFEYLFSLALHPVAVNNSSAYPFVVVDLTNPGDVYVHAVPVNGATSNWISDMAIMAETHRREFRVHGAHQWVKDAVEACSKQPISLDEFYEELPGSAALENLVIERVREYAAVATTPLAKTAGAGWTAYLQLDAGWTRAIDAPEFQALARIPISFAAQFASRASMHPRSTRVNGRFNLPAWEQLMRAKAASIGLHDTIVHDNTAFLRRKYEYRGVRPVSNNYNYKAFTTEDYIAWLPDEIIENAFTLLGPELALKAGRLAQFQRNGYLHSQNFTKLMFLLNTQPVTIETPIVNVYNSDSDEESELPGAIPSRLHERTFASHMAKLDLNSKAAIVGLINYPSKHYTCYKISLTKNTGRIEYYDSFGAPIGDYEEEYKDNLLAISKAFRPQVEHWEVTYCKLSNQYDGSSCGYHSLWNMLCLAMDFDAELDPVYFLRAPDDQPHMLDFKRWFRRGLLRHHRLG